MSPKAVTDATFGTEVLSAGTPVLVDFWADWCGPCRMMAPMLEDVAEEFAGRVNVAKLNIEENPMTADRYQIASVPTLMVFSGGEAVKTITGPRTKAALLRELGPFT